MLVGSTTCKGTGRDATVVYECRDPAVLGAGEPISKWLEVEGSDGEPWVTSLAGRPGELAAGDVVHVGELALVLDGLGHHRYLVEDDGRRVSLSLDGGPKRLVGLVVDDAAVLAALTDQERRGLRGVRLAGWSDAMTAELQRLPLEHVVVAYDRSDAMMKAGPAKMDSVPAVPPLPVEVRYLELQAYEFAIGLLPGTEEPQTDPDQGLSALARLTALRHLVIRTSNGPDAPLDLEWLRPLGSLRHLAIETYGRMTTGSEDLAALTSLRSLDVSGIDGLRLESLASLSELRWLDLRGAKLGSLAPLSGHASLEVIEARGSDVAELPSGPMPALRDLTLVGTKVSAADVARFREQVPAARVTLGMNQALADSTACAERIRVRSGGLCHRDPGSEETLLEVADPAEVRAFLPLLTVNESDQRGSCMCCGQPTIELYRGERLVAEIGFHHGTGLRFRGWSGDGWMSDAGADGLCKWLEERGVKACEERVQEPTSESSQSAR